MPALALRLSQWQIVLGVHFHEPYFLAKPAKSWPAFAPFTSSAYFNILPILRQFWK